MQIEKWFDVGETALALVAIYLFVPSFVVKETWLSGVKLTPFFERVRSFLKFLRLELDGGETKQTHQIRDNDIKRFSLQLTFVAVAIVFYLVKLAVELVLVFRT